MSEWGISNFENESATAFLADLDVNGYGLIEVALDRILEEDADPSIIECEEALAAAELVAAAAGKPSPELPEDAVIWLNECLPTGSNELAEVTVLNEKAADAIDKIVTDSELKSLWEEHEGFNDWFDMQVALQNRLLD
jgi:hypothetical protein